MESRLSIKEEPRFNPEAHNCLGCVYAIQGKFDDARTEISAAAGDARGALFPKTSIATFDT